MHSALLKLAYIAPTITIHNTSGPMDVVSVNVPFIDGFVFPLKFSLPLLYLIFEITLVESPIRPHLPTLSVQLPFKKVSIRLNFSKVPDFLSFYPIAFITGPIC